MCVPPIPPHRLFCVPMTLLKELVETSVAIGATAARGEKVGRLAGLLRRLEPGEAQIGVGYASVRDLPAPATEASLSLMEVDVALETIGQLAGRDSQAERRRQLV